jgi:hypothetical protein
MPMVRSAAASGSEQVSSASKSKRAQAAARQRLIDGEAAVLLQSVTDCNCLTAQRNSASTRAVYTTLVEYCQPYKETAMKRRIAMLAAVFVVGVGAATAASARDSFAISIGAPGFGIGYSSRGYGFAYAAPPVVYSPPAVYAPYPYSYYAPAAVYGGPYVSYYRPYARYRYWHRY